MKLKLFIMRDEGFGALADIQEKLGLNHNYDPEIRKIWRFYLISLRRLIEAQGFKFVLHRNSALQGRVRKLVANQKVLNLDSYGSLPGRIDLGVSRIFAPGGVKKIRVGARPGYSAVEEQLGKIASQKGKYILVEDDIFSGGTIKYTVALLAKYQIEVTRVLVGCAIGQTDISVPVQAIHHYSSDSVHDLADPRDFLLGTREGGLVVEVDDKSYRVPYVAPLVDMAFRVGLKPGPAIQLSKQILELNSQVFTKLGILAKRLVTVADLGHFTSLYLTDVEDFQANAAVIDVCKQLIKKLK